jgi:phosphoribosylformylglycinamidine cyclo-ligase
MPGFYADGEYDIAGFIVGVVDRGHVIDGTTLVPGDVLIGVPSSGLHTNGYSLARRIAFERLGLGVDSYVPELGRSVGDALLETHRSYLSLMKPLLGRRWIKGMAHITGGGITDNLPRILPAGTSAVVRPGAWEVPPLFGWLQRSGSVPVDDMRRTFNMGIGLIVAISPEHVESCLEALASGGGAGSCVIGDIVPGTSPEVLYR